MLARNAFFCDSKESISFDCPFARLVWRVIYFTLGLYGYPLDLQMILSFLRRPSERIWILDALVWRRLHRLSTTRLIVGFVEDYNMHMYFILFLFHWLIFVSTLCDPWAVNQRILKCWIKAVVCINWWTGWSYSPYFKKYICTSETMSIIEGDLLRLLVT
jgi:hypothetical protein